MLLYPFAALLILLWFPFAFIVVGLVIWTICKSWSLTSEPRKERHFVQTKTWWAALVVLVILVVGPALLVREDMNSNEPAAASIHDY